MLILQRLIRNLLNWGIVALQCCVGFCSTTVNQLYVDMYLLNLGPSGSLFPPMQVIRELRVELPVLTSRFPLAINFAYGSVYMGFPGGSDDKGSISMQETWAPSLGWEDALEEGLVSHFSILAWRIPMDRGAW